MSDFETAGVVKSDASGVGRVTNPEVRLLPTRRRYSREYKMQILEEVDRCEGNGDIGMLLRREGLYSSALDKWRHWRDRMNSPESKLENRRSRDLANENARLRRENARLQWKLKRADGLIELQKKVYALLEENRQETGKDGRRS